MRIIIDIEPKEIAALVQEVQERQERTADTTHETIKKIAMAMCEAKEHVLLI